MLEHYLCEKHGTRSYFYQKCSRCDLLLDKQKTSYMLLKKAYLKDIDNEDCEVAEEIKSFMVDVFGDDWLERV